LNEELINVELSLLGQAPHLLLQDDGSNIRASRLEIELEDENSWKNHEKSPAKPTIWGGSWIFDMELMEFPKLPLDLERCSISLETANLGMGMHRILAANISILNLLLLSTAWIG
jgi:hypothetical protein